MPITPPRTVAHPDSTFAAILADPENDVRVRLEGRLIRKSGNQNCIFSDATGEITIGIDADDFPITPPTAETIVIIEGEVDTHRFKDTDIDRDRITIRQ